MENIEEVGATCTRVIEAILGPHADVLFIAIAFGTLIAFGVALKKYF